MKPTTCTIGPLATTGELCGKPAVLTFGEHAECADHARPITLSPEAKPKRIYLCYQAKCRDYYGYAHGKNERHV
jgi:hypothetical protein